MMGTCTPVAACCPSPSVCACSMQAGPPACLPARVHARNHSVQVGIFVADLGSFNNIDEGTYALLGAASFLVGRSWRRKGLGSVGDPSPCHPSPGFTCFLNPPSHASILQCNAHAPQLPWNAHTLQHPFSPP